MDDGARKRIERQHEALRDAGVNVDADRQLYATGTRMADVGYRNQTTRAAEHAAKEPIDAAVQGTRATDRGRAAPRRHDDGGKLGSALSINGALKFDGFKLREQAIRGLLGRMESPALRYVLGLRDRIASPEATDASQALDKAALLDVMQRECRRFGDTPIKLRTREGLDDVFAIVSPDYAPADAPDVWATSSLPFRPTLAGRSPTIPLRRRGSFGHPSSRPRRSMSRPWANPSRVIVSFSSRDNGTRRLTGGGGIVLLACLNASTYEAESQSRQPRASRGDPDGLGSHDAGRVEGHSRALPGVGHRSRRRAGSPDDRRRARADRGSDPRLLSRDAHCPTW